MKNFFLILSLENKGFYFLSQNFFTEINMDSKLKARIILNEILLKEKKQTSIEN